MSRTIFIMNIARVAHQVNKAYCESIGDHSQVDWEDAEDWQKSSSVAGVRAIFDGDIKGPGDSHRSWLYHKE